ncbi:MAG: CvpA family protein [Candidatus Aceula lacicola]|nr:CvpA family protein [Candidatus Aceula lacicola]
MINSVDITIFLFILFFFATGWQKGIVRFSINFIAMILGTAISFYYFSATQNFLQSIALLIFGSIGLSVLLSILLKSWNKKFSRSKSPAFLSQLLGSLLGLGWALWMVIIIIFTILILPINSPTGEKIKTAITQSYVYTHLEYQIPLFQKFFGSKTPKSKSTSSSVSEFKSPPVNEKQIEIFRSKKEFQDIYQNESLQEIINDADLREKIEQRDVTALMNDPKMQGLLQDEDFMKNIMGLYSTILQQDIKESPKN